MANVLNFPKRPLGDAAPQLGPGAKGQAVADVQGLLQQLGYDVNADGVFGPETRGAVSKFQSDENARRGAASAQGEAARALRTDGVVDTETYNALVSKKGTPGVEPTYQPTSRPGVTQGGAAATYVPPATIAGRPIWQWGLIAAGIVGALWFLSKHLDSGGFHGLVSDAEPKSRGEKVVEGKCRRVPASGKLDKAERLEAIA